MNLLETSLLSPEFKEQVFALWNKEYPVNLQHKSLEELYGYIENLQSLEHGLLLDDKGILKAWFAKYLKEGHPYFVLIVSDEIHGKGHGTFMIDRLKKGNSELYGWVIDHETYKKEDGSPYPSPLNFYIKNGFVVLDQRMEKNNFSAVKVRWKK